MELEVINVIYNGTNEVNGFYIFTYKKEILWWSKYI